MYFNIELLNFNIFLYFYEISWIVYDDCFEFDDGEFFFSNIDFYYIGIWGVVILICSNSKCFNIFGKVLIIIFIYC